MTNKGIETRLTFEIVNSVGMFNKLLEEYSDFDKQHLNPRFALNCAITSWHLSDWTFIEFFQKDERFQDSTIVDKKGIEWRIKGIAKYQSFVIKECPELEYMRLIANGAKHCVLNDKRRKETACSQHGDYSSDYDRKEYDVSRFIIKINTRKRLDFEETLIVTIKYWETMLSLKQKSI